MFKTLINAWNVKDIRTKMLYTLLLVVIYRFGSFIPVPGGVGHETGAVYNLLKAFLGIP